ncbi:MAG: DUF3857 domain-containing protein [Verrucomicrobiaceae bacterium]|nr:DUF3857 domain-containing protein [Verrucomicrobiaceae bacterium]
MKTSLSIAALFSVLMSGAGLAQPVSTRPPRDYTALIAPLLVPLETVLKNAGEPPKDAEHGWIILDETLQHVRTDGTRLIVEHQICRAISQSGAEGLGREVNAYRLSTQTPHLVLARSIQPDGLRQEVKPEACFLQTPQREADYDLYNDSGELVVIFPNVKPGTVTEFIIVTEEKKPRIPGHYVTSFDFRYGWPVRQLRAVSELPADYAKRLNLTPLGAGVPDPVVEKLKSGRQRWTWEVERTLPTRSEPGRAPYDQTGPLVRLNTLRDWTEFADWYRPLAEKNLVLGKKLEAEVEKWTAAAKSPREVLDILHTHVANDVRYVGLEFGSCDIEPHTASEVWDHQYGDCKDKASLLAALLRHKNIPAHLVLVNTNHLGRVERRCADWRDFNHAILVADLPDGPVFCDPTIEGSAPGMLAPSSAERDVLVMSKPERWMRTPGQDAGHYAMNLDAQMSATGELSGWATLEADGYLGTYFQNIEKTSTREQLKDRLRKHLEDVWQGAGVIDIKTMARESGAPYRIQAYFIVPSSGSPTLRFPFDVSYLPDFGSGEARQTDAFMWRDRNSTHSVITLPTGVRPASVPAPLTVTHEHGSGTGRWNLEGGKLHAELSFQVKSSRLPAAEVQDFMESVAALRAWLDKPVTMETAGNVGPDGAGAPPADSLATMPRMPSGEGQIDLIAERFPLDGDLNLRRKAYEKMIEWFPKDAHAQFFAQTQIAYVEHMQEKHAEAVRRLRGLLAAQKGSMPVEDSAFAEYVLAIALRGQKQDAGALELLEGIARHKEISTFRRAWAQTVRSQILEEKEPAKALEAAQAGLDLHDGDVAALLQSVCILHARLGQAEPLKKSVAAFLAKETPRTAEQMRALAASVNDLALEKPADARLLAETLAAFGEEDRFGKQYNDALASARVRSEAQGLFGGIRERLNTWLAAHPDDLPAWQVPDTLKTQEDFTAAIEKALQRENYDYAELTRLAVESLVRFEPGAWYGERLWRAATYVELLDRKQVTAAPPPLMMQLIELCESTPPQSDPHVEARFLRALMLKRRDQRAEEAEILRELIQRPGIDDGYRLSAIDRVKDCAVARGKPTEVFEVLRLLRKYPTYYSVPTSLLEGILLALETGDEKTAFELLGDLRAIKPAITAKTTAADHVTSFLKLAEDEKALRAWWEHSARWWPVWQAFERDHLPARDVKDPLVPVIPSLSAFGEQLRKNSDAGLHKDVLDSVRLLGHAARWQPGMAVELCTLASMGLPALEKIVADYRKLVIAIHDVGGFTEAVQSARVAIWAAIAHIDGTSPQSGIDIARAYLEKNGSKDDFGLTMLRLWAVAAVKTGKDLAAPTAALVKRLASSDPNGNRAMTVKSLAGLYQKQNMRAEELALLKAEIDDQRNKDAGDGLTQLRQRYETLLDGGGGGDGPALAVKAWLSTQKPAWYDHMRPKDLKDEKAADPDEAMAPGNEKSLTIPEAVKLCCLVALDSEQPEQRRLSAVQYLGWYLPVISSDMQAFKSGLDALKNEKNLPRPVRAFTIWLAARKSYWNDLHAPLRHALAEPLLDHLREDLSGELAAIRRYARVDPQDLDATEALATEILKGTLDYISLESLQRCIRRLAEAGSSEPVLPLRTPVSGAHRLAEAGRLEQARRHYKAMSTARYDEESARQKAAQQLAALKTINAAQKLKPVHDALKAWFLASHVAKSPGAKPVPEPMDSDDPLDMPDEEKLQLFRQQVQKSSWPREDLDFWIHVVQALPRNEKLVPAALEMLHIALEKAPDDEIRANLVDDASGLVDLDDPPTLAKLDEVLKPWRARQDMPSTQDALRLHDFTMKLRVGQEVDLFAALATLQTPNRQSFARARLLTALVAREDKAGLKRLINMIEPDELLGRGLIDESIHAYRLLDMKDEQELATDQMRQIIERELIGAWMSPHGDKATAVVYFATQLEDPSLVPTEFTTYISSRLRDPHEKWFFIAKDAFLRRDWEKCAQAAKEGIKIFSTIYDYHYLLGMAEAALGHKDAAITALSTYVKFDHNTREATLANKRLAELRKP